MNPKLAVFKKSTIDVSGATPCRGHDFAEVETTGSVDYDALFDSLLTTGFQATSFGQAVEIIRASQAWRLSDEVMPDDEDDDMRDPQVRKNVRCLTYLGYTSNMISCGVRESILYLAKNHLIDIIVTTAGGVEEDFIKCLAPHLMGDFNLDGAMMRERGLNRIGNLIVPNENYCKFEAWFNPLLARMHDEQIATGKIWSPSTIVRRLGEAINDERSVYYWCYRNNIPVYCPALTDGSIGDMIYFHVMNRPGFVVDIVADVALLNRSAVFARKTAMIIVGGGVIKHHVCNANLMRNGADYAVFVNTASEYDGSDSGAKPDEAISWGKLRTDARHVKLHGDASLLLPLLVARAFCDRRTKTTPTTTSTSTKEGTSAVK